MKGTKKLSEKEDWEACDSTLQISRFLVLTEFSEIFIVRAPNWRCDDMQERQAKKNYYEASDSVLQIGYLLGSKTVQGEFHRKSSKIWLWSRAPNNMKAMIPRHVNEFWKFAIFLVVMA